MIALDCIKDKEKFYKEEIKKLKGQAYYGTLDKSGYYKLGFYEGCVATIEQFKGQVTTT